MSDKQDDLTVTELVPDQEQISFGSSIPIAPGFPIIGSLPQLIKKQLGFFTDTRAQCGDAYYLRLGPTKMLVCNHPEQAKRILVDNQPNYRRHWCRNPE